MLKWTATLSCSGSPEAPLRTVHLILPRLSRGVIRALGVPQGQHYWHFGQVTAVGDSPTNCRMFAESCSLPTRYQPHQPTTPTKDSDNQKTSPNITKWPWGIKVEIGYFLELDKVVSFNGKKKQMKLSKYILRQKKEVWSFFFLLFFYCIFSNYHLAPLYPTPSDTTVIHILESFISFLLNPFPPTHPPLSCQPASYLWVCLHCTC